MSRKKEEREIFEERNLNGKAVEEIVTTLFKTKYQVIPYAWEKLFPTLINNAHNNNSIYDQIRTQPDIITNLGKYNQLKLIFIEIKSCNTQSPKTVLVPLEEIELQKKYWNNTILVVAINDEETLYAIPLRLIHQNGDGFVNISKYPNGELAYLINISQYPFTKIFKAFQDTTELINTRRRIKEHFASRNGRKSQKILDDYN